MHEMFTDTLEVNAISWFHQNRYAQVFVTHFGWSRVFPMKQKAGTHEELSLMAQHDGIPPRIIMHGSKEQTMGIFQMEMLMNSGDISTNMTNEEVSMSDNEKMFLYARAVHSNHSIQYHMHQIMERQRVIDEYRNMTMEGLDLIPLESNLHKFNLVIISQIIKMIESDNFLALQDI